MGEQDAVVATADADDGNDDDEVALLVVLSVVRHGYEKPIRGGTTAPPSSKFRSDARALRLAVMAKDTGKHFLTSASERMSMLFERILTVCRIIRS
jgi:hypothetical protein